MANVFKQHPNLKECFQTSDDKCFFKEDVAKEHARKSKLKDKSVKKLINTGSEKETKEKKLSAEERIEAINAMTSIKAVEQALDGERAKTILEAGANKIEALTKAIDTNSQNVSEETKE